MRRPTHLAFALVLLTGSSLPACLAGGAPETDGRDPESGDDRVGSGVIERLRRQIAVDVMVGFDPATGCRLDQVATGGWETLETFQSMPVARVRLESLAALKALLDSDSVRRVETDEVLQIEMADGLELIGQPGVAAAGLDGAGASVAVLDTGVDFTLPELGGCERAGAPGCPIRYAVDIAPDDGERDAHGHGTNVAGIVHGVAPAAGILSFDVAEGTGVSTSNLVRAIDWIIAHREEHQVVAINMSVGGGAFDTPCGSTVIALAIECAREAGIVSVASAGNDGLTGALSSPGCAPSAVSVAAVYASAVGGLGYPVCEDPRTSPDQITCFSNVAPFLTMLAPGVLVQAGGHTMTGTSQAAPHVAGAVAVLAQAFPAEDPAAWVDRLRRTGQALPDPRTGLAYPRLDLRAAAQDALEPPPPPPPPAPPPDPGPLDTTAPCDGEAWAWRDVGSVSLEWEGFADDDSGVAGYRVTFSTTTPPVTCLDGTLVYEGPDARADHRGLLDGVKHYYRVCAFDRAGNVSSGVLTAATPGEPIRLRGPDGQWIRMPG